MEQRKIEYVVTGEEESVNRASPAMAEGSLL